MKYAKLIAVAIAMWAGNALAMTQVDNGYVDDDGLYHTDDILVGFEYQNPFLPGWNVYVEQYKNSAITLRWGYGRLGGGLETYEALLAFRFYTNKRQWLHFGLVSTRGEFKGDGCGENLGGYSSLDDAYVQDQCELKTEGVKFAYGREYDIAEHTILRTGVTYTDQYDYEWERFPEGETIYADEFDKSKLSFSVSLISQF